MKDKIAIGGICIGLLVTGLWGAVADLRMSAKAERQMRSASVHLQDVCLPLTVDATHGNQDCVSKPDRTQVYYRARMDTLAQN